MQSRTAIFTQARWALVEEPRGACFKGQGTQHGDVLSRVTHDDNLLAGANGPGGCSRVRVLTCRTAGSSGCPPPPHLPQTGQPTLPWLRLPYPLGALRHPHVMISFARTFYVFSFILRHAKHPILVFSVKTKSATCRRKLTPDEGFYRILLRSRKVSVG